MERIYKESHETGQLMNSFECLLPYDELAEGPGVARGKKKIEKKILKKSF